VDCQRQISDKDFLGIWPSTSAEWAFLVKLTPNRPTSGWPAMGQHPQESARWATMHVHEHSHQDHQHCAPGVVR
jgi:hypothetical protein